MSKIDFGFLLTWSTNLILAKFAPNMYFRSNFMHKRCFILKNLKINLFLQNKTKASLKFLQTKDSNYFDSNCVKHKTYMFLYS